MPSRGSCCASPFRRCACPPGPRGPTGPAGPAGPSAEMLLSGDSQDQDFTVITGVLLPVTVATSLNPASSSLFTNTVAGQLKYTGNTAKTFTLHGQVNMQWLNSDIAIAGTSADFVLGLIVDGTVISTGAWSEALIRASVPGDRARTYHTQRLAQLNPDSIVQLSIAAIRPPGEQETVRFTSLSLIAAAA